MENHDEDIDREEIIEQLVEKAEAYARTTHDLARLKAVDKATNLISIVISKFMVVILVALFFIILSIGGALYLGERTGHAYYGFSIVACIYLLLAILFHVFRNAFIKRPITERIIKHTLQ